MSLQATPGPGALALLCAEGGESGCDGVQARMQATGKFTSVDTFDITSTTPALSAISGYGSVLAWTDDWPADPTAVGNLLASYYALGGKRLVVSTYAFSSPWGISGAIMTGSNAALTNVNSNGSVNAKIVPVVSDAIFSGTDMTTVSFWQNSNYAHPGLAPGATLLATDGAGVNMVARSANGVININVWPAGTTDVPFFNFLAVALTTGSSAIAVPAISLWSGTLMVAGVLLLAFFGLRRRIA